MKERDDFEWERQKRISEGLQDSLDSHDYKVSNKRLRIAISRFEITIIKSRDEILIG